MAAIARDERAWLRRARAGSASDLEALFRLHWPRAYRVAYLIVHEHVAAEEIAEESCLAAVRHLDSFDVEEPIGPWLHRLVATRSIDAARARMARREVQGESYLDLDAPLGWPTGPETPQPLLDPQTRAIAGGLAALTAEDRAVVVLRTVVDYEPREIARLLELPRRAVRDRLARGLDQVAVRLEAGTMSARDLRTLLLSQPVPDEQIAEERTWEVVREAFQTRQPVPHHRRLPWRLLALLAVVAGAAGVALSPAGPAIVDWIDARTGEGVATTVETATAPAPITLPAPGRLLVTDPRGVWVIHEDGARVHVGDYPEAAWAPTGIYVAAWTDERLVELDPARNEFVHWSLERPDIADVRWSPTGLRIAYRSGSALRVVVENGTRDRELAANVPELEPSWRPGRGEVIAYAEADGKLAVVEADTGKALWRTARAPVPVALAWADAATLVALEQRRLRLLADPGELVASFDLPEGTGGLALAPRPGSADVAYSVFSPDTGKSSVYILDTGRKALRLLFAGAGGLDRLVWSPDGRYLLVPWKPAGQWLFVPAGKGGKIPVEPGVAARFDPGAGGGAFPEPVGWCCVEP
ncbi:MAG: RNA polymerase sigma factor [Thermoleophilia bacterium]|nr:RNA polymerase sigma factor [Thermoleophilia bacterium]